jgi:hypothetical protein
MKKILGMLLYGGVMFGVTAGLGMFMMKKSAPHATTAENADGEEDTEAGEHGETPVRNMATPTRAPMAARANTRRPNSMVPTATPLDRPGITARPGMMNSCPWRFVQPL